LSDIKREMMMDRIEALTNFEHRQSVAIGMLLNRLDHARAKHPVFAEYEARAIYVIGEEYAELRAAYVNGEGSARVIDEALDVAATAMRLVMGEVQG